MGTRALEYVLCPIGIIPTARMHGNKDIAAPKFPFVAFRFKLWHSHSHKSAGEASDRRARGSTAQGYHDRTGG